MIKPVSADSVPGPAKEISPGSADRSGGSDSLGRQVEAAAQAQPAPRPPGLLDPNAWRLRLAQLCARAGRVGAAEGIYRKLLARHPGQAGALIGLARLLRDQRRYAEAAEAWRRAALLRPRSSGVLFQLARALHRNGDLAGASAQYLRVVALEPGHAQAAAAFDQVVEQALRRWRATDAQARAVADIVDTITAVSGRSPELSAPAVLAIVKRLVDRLAAAGDALGNTSPAPALKRYRAALALDPAHPGALRGAARCCEQLGEAAEALALRQALVRLRPAASEPLLQRDRLLSLLRREEPELKQEQHLAATDPHPALLAAARGAYGKGQLDEAAALLRPLLQAEPVKPEALALIGRIHMRREDWSQAVEVLRQLDAAAPSSAESKEMLARGLAGDGQLAAAAAVYEEILRLRPDDPQILGRPIAIYSRLGDGPAACRIGRLLVERDPGSAQPRILYAQALQQIGQEAQAEAQLEAALALDAAEPNGLAMLGRLRAKSDPQAAAACWERLAQRGGEGWKSAKSLRYAML
ncbi:MAG: tetratricopeptide repeat protein, partial [Thiohalocapsa sp.]